jgi:glycosyltransferase involved in cell wall biosynthesis
VIGWFGMLRCRRSFAELARLAVESDGAVRVVIAGIPSANEFVDFDAMVANAPGVDFAGAYTAADLPQLYRGVHFAWAIDYFEEGLNSAWLLPNRLYESMAHGAVPVALSSVETGNWLRRNNAGIVVEEAVSALPPILAGMTEVLYGQQRARVAAVADQLLFTTVADCIELVEEVLGQAGE